jgi:hypothetical protein
MAKQPKHKKCRPKPTRPRTAKPTSEPLLITILTADQTRQLITLLAQHAAQNSHLAQALKDAKTDDTPSHTSTSQTDSVTNCEPPSTLTIENMTPVNSWIN